MSKHTPGPWSLKTYTYFSGGTEQGDVVDPDGRTIRVCGVSLTSTPESKANARLIGAAPELLEALQYIFENGTIYSSAIEADTPHVDFEEWEVRARAAIAKATGDQA